MTTKSCFFFKPYILLYADDTIVQAESPKDLQKHSMACLDTVPLGTSQLMLTRLKLLYLAKAKSVLSWNSFTIVVN